MRTADFPSTTACRQGQSQLLEGSSLLRSQSHPAVSPRLPAPPRGRGTAEPLSSAWPPAAMSPPALRAQMGQAPGLRGSLATPASQPVSVGQSHRRHTPRLRLPHTPHSKVLWCTGASRAGSCPQLRGKGPPGLKLILSVTHSGTISPPRAAWSGRQPGNSPTNGLGWDGARGLRLTKPPEGRATRRLHMYLGARGHTV